MESICSNLLAIVAFIPAIKIRKIKVAWGRNNGIANRTLHDLLTRKRICVGLVSLNFALDFVVLNRLVVITQDRQYPFMAEYRTLSVIVHLKVVRCTLQSLAQQVRIRLGIIKMHIEKSLSFLRRHATKIETSHIEQSA